MLSLDEARSTRFGRPELSQSIRPTGHPAMQLPGQLKQAPVVLVVSSSSRTKTYLPEYDANERRLLFRQNLVDRLGYRFFSAQSDCAGADFIGHIERRRSIPLGSLFYPSRNH
jgi:hypothetical protein